MISHDLPWSDGESATSRAQSREPQSHARSPESCTRVPWRAHLPPEVQRASLTERCAECCVLASRACQVLSGNRRGHQVATPAPRQSPGRVEAAQVMAD